MSFFDSELDGRNENRKFENFKCQNESISEAHFVSLGQSGYLCKKQK